ncbi:MAG: RNA polymerase factor sigma-54 [Chlamydiota bacterium]|nr:RNA polymerase factor sigma-54 [Chlamydiota bacterium]
MADQMSLKQHNKTQQSLKQTQRLIMSPQMQQAIKLLQVPILELSQTIQQELETNPVIELVEEQLERDYENEQLEESIQESESDFSEGDELNFENENFDIIDHLNDDYNDLFGEAENYSLRRSTEEDKLKTFLEANIQKNTSLYDTLITQARETFETETEIQAAETIIGSLDDKGFLSSTLHEIAIFTGVNESTLKKVLPVIQTFDPPGIAAISLKDSLLLQLMLKGKQNSLAFKIIQNHFKDLLHNKIKVITAKLHCTPKQVSEAVSNDISKLDLQPGNTLSDEYPQGITPDLHIFIDENGQLATNISNEFIPNLKINSKYLKMIDDPNVPEETKSFIQQKISSAQWLLKNITERNNTIERIGLLLVKTQKQFFENPNGKLVPMTMKKYSEELDLHESTIARAVSNKYLSCDRGIFPLRFFFTNAIECDDGSNLSSTSVKDLLDELIKGENKLKPYSDEILSRLLKRKGVRCARRTIAKYRAELNLGNAQQRKKFT